MYLENTLLPVWLAVATAVFTAVGFLNPRQNFWKVLTFLSAGAFATSLCLLAANSFVGVVVSFGIGLLTFVATGALSLKQVEAEVVKVFQPLVRAQRDALDIYECVILRPGMRLFWGFSVEHVADVPIGNISFVYPLDVQFTDGSGKIEVAFVGLPPLADDDQLLPLLEKFILSTESGKSLSNAEERNKFISNWIKARLVQTFEEIAKTRSIFATADRRSISAQVIQSVFEEKMFQAVDLGTGATIRYSYEDALLGQIEAERGLPIGGVKVTVSNIVLNEDAIKAIKTRSTNTAIQRSAEEIIRSFNVKTVPEHQTELLGQQAAKLKSLEAKIAATDLVARERELLGQQQREAGLRHRKLETAHKGKIEPKDYRDTVMAGANASAAAKAMKDVSAYAQSYAMSEAEVQEASDAATATKLSGTFAEKMAAEKDALKKMEAEAATLRQALQMQPPSLVGEFAEADKEYQAYISEMYREARRMAAAGEDASYIATSGLNLGQMGSEGLQKLIATMTAIKKGS